MSSPSPAGVSRGRRRVTFEADAEPVKSKVTSVGFVRHTLAFDEGKTLSLDYSGLPCPRLVRHLTAALASRAGVGGGHLTIGTGRMYGSAIRAFVPFIAGRYPARVRSFDASDLTAADIDAFEEAQRSRLPSDSGTPYLRVGSVVRLLRVLAEGGQVALRTDLLARLDYVANGLKGHSTPRDAYSPAETSRLRDACRADVLAIIERLTVTGEQRLATGCEPVGRGWRVPENVMWHIDRHGPVRESELQKHQGRLKVGFRIADLNKLLYPTRADLVPFLLLLALESGLELEACKELRADCLGTATGGRVEIHYRKRRAGSYQWRSLWVHDAGMFSPGRLVRIVLRLTSRARAHSGSEWLWLSVHNPRVTRPTFTVGSSLFTSFVARHGLCADSGDPLSLQPVRLRKTYKAGRYLITQGQLPDFAGGSHTETVAGDHYGAIEACGRSTRRRSSGPCSKPSPSAGPARWSRPSRRRSWPPTRRWAVRCSVSHRRRSKRSWGGSRTSGCRAAGTSSIRPSGLRARPAPPRSGPAWGAPTPSSRPGSFLPCCRSWPTWSKRGPGWRPSPGPPPTARHTACSPNTSCPDSRRR